MSDKWPASEEHPIFDYQMAADRPEQEADNYVPLPASVRIARAICWLLFGVAFLAFLTTCMLVGNGVIHQ